MSVIKKRFKDSKMTFTTMVLNPDHDRSGFNCGVDPLDTYIKKISKQDMKRFLNVVHVMTQKDDSKVIGYYTLSNMGVPRSNLPDDIIKKLPRGYEHLPATLIGRLARDIEFKGQGIGEALLLDALRRSYDLTQTSAGSMAVVVDPTNDNATDFYRRFGFLDLPDRERMFIPMATIKQLVS